MTQSIEDKFSLPVDVANPARENIVTPLLLAQAGIGDGAADGVRIRIPMANNKNLFFPAHKSSTIRDASNITQTNNIFNDTALRNPRIIKPEIQFAAVSIENFRS